MRLVAPILVALLASAALPATPDPSEKPTGDGYILAVGDKWMSSGMDLDDLVRMRDRLAGDFLWFRRAGKTYRVLDAPTLAKAEALFGPLRVLEPEFEDLRRKERRLDAKENELDREEELIEQELEDLDADEEAGIAVDGNARKNLESRREAVRSRMRDVEKEQRQLESVERQLDAREETLEAEAETKLWRLIDETIASGAAKSVPR
jgi:hypothetical protein